MMHRPLAIALFALLLAIGAAEAAGGSMTGAATDDEGRPLEGVHVEAVYQTYRAERLGRHGASVKKTAVTGSGGRYRIDLTGLPPGEYRANAYQVVANGERRIQIGLLPDNAGRFASNEAVVRNFRAVVIEMSEEHPYGNAGVFVLRNAVADYTDLSGAEVTLTNVASGRTYVKSVRPTGEGLVVTGIAFGTYRCSVRLHGRAVRIALSGTDDAFSDSVVHDFTMGDPGNQFRVDAKL